MKKIERILIPTDFSQLSLQAADKALKLCYRLDAKPIFLHAIDESFVLYTMGGFPSQYTQLSRTLLEGAEKKMEEMFKHLGLKTRPETTIRAYIGAIGDFISEFSISSAADLIVMATHSRSAVSRWMLGSVTYRAIRESPCPLLVFSPDALKSTAVLPNTIFCPTDFSTASESAARYALSLGKVFNSKIVLLHVRSASDVAFLTELSDQQRVELENQVALNDRKNMEQLEKGLGSANVSTRLVDWSVDSIPKTIAKEAKKNEADWIVISTHSRTGWDRIILGSVTERLIHLTSNPILVYAWSEKDERSRG